MDNTDLTVSNFMEYPIGLKSDHRFIYCGYVNISIFRQVYNLTYS